ncbi:MAG: hypothetical protein KJ578_07560 [Bacteroidetes bacterium]|jgi:hypothetical protein|nr:hypothetical protein [Bacteroidota bacterium]MBU1579718.1 hypothetical protein [Bacteroidota bacterium]MBU2465779.1 hypothetical protein [Bacteroidota bacterium]MBU2557619.1 hypothetical protein [Bacteroidota bacterium]MDA3944358.1 hypothetical protein [Bacteroidota bacterium]
MTSDSKKMTGIILLSLPTIIFGGNFILNLLSGQHQQLELTEFQISMFRAGHGHAGVLVVLAIIAQMLTDQTNLNDTWKWIVRGGFPLSALVVSGGFFAAAGGVGTTEPNSFIFLLYTGMILLAFSLVVLGVGLLRK